MPTNGDFLLTLTNSSVGIPYEVLYSYSVTNAISNWLSLGVWPGGPGNTTPVPIPVNLGTNPQCYFDARVWAFDRFANGAPANGQLLLLLLATNAIHAMVNSVSNSLTPFESAGSNYVLLVPHSTASTSAMGVMTAARQIPALTPDGRSRTLWGWLDFQAL